MFTAKLRTVGTALFVFVLAMWFVFPATANATTGTMVVTQNTVLTEDQFGQITMAADNITLDCAGFQVVGGNWYDAIGILLEGRTGVVVKDCRVSGFYNGVVLLHSSGNTITGNEGTLNVNAAFALGEGSTNNLLSLNMGNNNVGNGFGSSDSPANTFIDNSAAGNRAGFAIGGANNVLRNNDADGNSERGFHLGDADGSQLIGNKSPGTGSKGSPLSPPTELSSQKTSPPQMPPVGLAPNVASNLQLTGNQASGNLVGFLMPGSVGSIVKGNVATTNNQLGFILIGGSSNGMFRGNSAIHNGAGFLIGDASNGNTFDKNQATGNSSFGFSLQGVSQDLLTANVARENGSDGSNGFELYGSSQNTLRGNTSVGNGGEGFRVADGSNENILSMNRATANAASGFDVTRSDGNMLSMNRSERSNGTGYSLAETSGLVLSGNTATGSTGVGIELHQSSNGTFRGNSSTRNWEGFLIADASNGNTSARTSPRATKPLGSFSMGGTRPSLPATSP